MSGDGRGRPRDPILEELRWLYPGVSERTLARWKAQLLAEAAALGEAGAEEKTRFIRERLMPQEAA